MKKMNLRALCFSTLKAKHYLAAMAAAVAVAANFAGETAIIGTAFFAASTMSGCEKDTAGNNGGISNITMPDLTPELGTYTPPAGTSQDALKALVVAAIAKLRTETQLTIVANRHEEEEIVYNYEVRQEFNATAKKKLETWSINGSLESDAGGSVVFTDSDKEYANEIDEQSDGQGGKTSQRIRVVRRPATNAARYFMWEGNELSSALDEEKSKMNASVTFRAEGSKIVVVAKEGDETTTHEVTLTGESDGKRFKTHKIIWSDKDAAGYSYSYAAVNPALPAGYSTSDFTDKTADYVSAKVAWGEGEDTFWEEPRETTTWDESGNHTTSTSATLSGSEISRYAPDVASKVIDYFTANGQEYCAMSGYSYADCAGRSTQVSLTEGMTITVVWK